MRYNLGQSYIFVKSSFKKGSTPRMSNLFFPWEDTDLKLDFIKLTCKSVHAVSGAYDDDLKCQGFIFEDANKNEWYNQYPRASYGQLDDSWDGRVLSAKGEEHYAYYTDITRFLDNIDRGIADFKKYPDSAYELAKMQEYLQLVISVFSETFPDYVIKQEPHIARYWSGKIKPYLTIKQYKVYRKDAKRENDMPLYSRLAGDQCVYVRFFKQDGDSEAEYHVLHDSGNQLTKDHAIIFSSEDLQPAIDVCDWHEEVMGAKHKQLKIAKSKYSKKEEICFIDKGKVFLFYKERLVPVEDFEIRDFEPSDYDRVNVSRYGFYIEGEKTDG